MKRIISLALILVMLCASAVCLVSCNETEDEKNGKTTTENTTGKSESAQTSGEPSGNGTITDTAKKVETELGIKYSDMYADIYAIEATEYPEEKKDSFIIFSKSEKTNDQRKEDILGFIHYFKTISDDGKIYTDKEFEMEWTDDLFTSPIISSIVWIYKKGGKAYYVNCSQVKSWCNDAKAQVYAYSFYVTELA